MEVFEGSKRQMGIGTEEDREGEIEKERTRFEKWIYNSYIQTRSRMVFP